MCLHVVAKNSFWSLEPQLSEGDVRSLDGVLSSARLRAWSDSFIFIACEKHVEDDLESTCGSSTTKHGSDGLFNMSPTSSFGMSKDDSLDDFETCSTGTVCIEDDDSDFDEAATLNAVSHAAGVWGDSSQDWDSQPFFVVHDWGACAGWDTQTPVCENVEAHAEAFVELPWESWSGQATNEQMSKPITGRRRGKRGGRRLKMQLAQSDDHSNWALPNESPGSASLVGASSCISRAWADWSDDDGF